MMKVAAAVFLTIGLLYNVVYEIQGAAPITTINALTDCSIAHDDPTLECTAGSLCAATPWSFLYTPTIENCICLPGLYPSISADSSTITCVPVAGTACTDNLDCLLLTADCSGVIKKLMDSGTTDRGLMQLLAQISVTFCSLSFPAHPLSNTSLGDDFVVASSILYQLYPVHNCVAGQCALPLTGVAQVPSINFLLYMTGNGLATAAEVFTLDLLDIYQRLGLSIVFP